MWALPSTVVTQGNALQLGFFVWQLDMQSRRFKVNLVGMAMCARTVVCMYREACTLNFVDLRYKLQQKLQLFSD